MPNYSFVVDATYDPLSYDEIANPLKEAAQYHQALQDKYDELKLTTQYMDAMIPKDDPEYATSRAYLDEYLNALNGGADALMKNGAWGQRDVFSGVRDMFGKKMMPVQMAWAKREQEDKEQRDLLAKNPLLELSRRASATGLDTYLNNPLSGYKTVDPAHVTGMVSTMAQAFAKELADHPDGPLALEIQKTDPEGFLAIVERKGLRPEQVLNWMKNPHLRGIMKTALNSVGMDMDDNGVGIGNDVWSADAVQRIIDKAYTGFASGVGGETLHLKEDQEYAARMAAARAAAANGGGGTYSPTDYMLTNDNSFSLDDQLTDGSYLDTLQNVASLYGLDFDKKSGKFTPNGGNMIDSFQARLANIIPFMEDSNKIMKKIAKEKGWTFQPGIITGKGLTGRGWLYETKNGKNRTITDKELADVLAKYAEPYYGRYHSLQDISLASGYNDAFKGVDVYPMKGKLGKGGVYDSEQDHPVPLGSILDDSAYGSKSIGLDATPTNGGLVIKTSKDGKPK